MFPKYAISTESRTVKTFGFALSPSFVSAATRALAKKTRHHTTSEKCLSARVRHLAPSATGKGKNGGQGRNRTTDTRIFSGNGRQSEPTREVLVVATRGLIC